MDIPDKLQDTLQERVFGQPQAVAQFVEQLRSWVARPAPRRALRILLTGPTSCGKERLVTAAAEAAFAGRFHKFAGHKYSSAQAFHNALRPGEGPAMIFFKWVNMAKGPTLDAVSSLLERGSMRFCGYGSDGEWPGVREERELQAQDRVIVLNTSGWNPDAPAHELPPQLAPHLDATIALHLLDAEAIAQIVQEQARELAAEKGWRLEVSVSAALRMGRSLQVLGSVS